MPRTCNLGSNVCLIHEFPSGNDLYYTDFQTLAGYKRKLPKFLDKVKYRHSLIITANAFQAPTRTIIKKYGFVPIVTFYSAHDKEDETLTLWLKTKKAPDYSNDKRGKFGWNCSVSINKKDDNYYRFVLAVETPNQTAQNLIKKKFKRIKNTPAFYKLEEGQEA